MSCPIRFFVLITLLAGLVIGVTYAQDKKNIRKKPKVAGAHTEDDILVRPVMNVPAAAIGQPGLSLDKPFNKIKALRKLIPGRYYHLEDYSTLDLVVWKSNDYKHKRFAGWFIGEPRDIFPFTDCNITEVADTIMFTDDSGARNVIFSFASHASQSVDDIHTGRYSCAMMGLAWFTEHDNKWVLKYFTPGIGCYGAFQSLPDLNLIKLGKNNYGCYILNSNGGPGQVYYSSMDLFAIVDGKFKIVLTEDAVGRTNTMSSRWYSRLTTLKTQTDSLFQPLSLKIDGNFNRDIPNPEYDTTDSPIELAKAIIGRDSFDFRVTRRFEYSKGKYRKVSSRYKLK